MNREIDERYMNLCLRLAKRGLGKTSPNPMVGAVVVKDHKIIGVGYHKKAGEPHAEVISLDKAGRDASGGTLYVNLEPCSHFGRTPPCTKKIIECGIKRVVVGILDPNPQVSGIKELKDAGIEVEIGVLKEESSLLNEVYLKYITTKHPFISIKAGMTLDGKIATRFGESKWITCEESRRFVHALRSQFDAVLVGKETVIMDNPCLTVRIEGRRKNPIRVVVDSKAAVPLGARVFNNDTTTILATTRFAPKQKLKVLEEKGVKVMVIEHKKGRVDLEGLMEELGRQEITSVLVEGGAEINASLLENRLVDRIMFFISPKIIGGDSRCVIGGEGVSSLRDAIELENIATKRIGEDLLVMGYVKGVGSRAEGEEKDGRAGDRKA